MGFAVMTSKNFCNNVWKCNPSNWTWLLTETWTVILLLKSGTATTGLWCLHYQIIKNAFISLFSPKNCTKVAFKHTNTHICEILIAECKKRYTLCQLKPRTNNYFLESVMSRKKMIAVKHLFLVITLEGRVSPAHLELKGHLFLVY